MNKTSKLEHLSPSEAKMIKVDHKSAASNGRNTVVVDLKCGPVLNMTLESADKVTVYFDRYGNAIGMSGLSSLTGEHETLCCPNYPGASCATHYNDKYDFYPDSDSDGSGTGGSGTGSNRNDLLSDEIKFL